MQNAILLRFGAKIRHWRVAGGRSRRYPAILKAQRDLTLPPPFCGRRYQTLFT
jgi:hypothetical protein